MKASITVRTASRVDIPQLLALYPHLNPTDPRPTIDLAERRLEELRKYQGSAVFVGIADEEIVVSCTLIVVPNLMRGCQPYGLIENVVTHSAYRRRGYAKHILKVAVAAAWRADCYKVMLMTGSKEPSTLAFYFSAGFEQSKTGFQVRRTIGID